MNVIWSDSDFKSNIDALITVDMQLIQCRTEKVNLYLTNIKNILLGKIIQDIQKSPFIVYMYKNDVDEYEPIIYTGTKSILPNIYYNRLNTFYSKMLCAKIKNIEDRIDIRYCLVLEDLSADNIYYVKKYKNMYILLDADKEKIKKVRKDLFTTNDNGILNYKTKAMNLFDFTNNEDNDNILRIKELSHFMFHTIDLDYTVFVMNNDFPIEENLKQFKHLNGDKYHTKRLLTAITRDSIGTDSEQFTIRLMDKDFQEEEFTLYCFKIYKSFIYFGIKNKVSKNYTMEENIMGKIEIKDNTTIQNKQDTLSENTVGNILLMKAGLLYLISKCKNEEKIEQLNNFINKLKNDEIFTINNWIYRFISDNILQYSYKELEYEIENKIFDAKKEIIPEMSSEFYNLLTTQLFNKDCCVYCISDEKNGLRKITGEAIHYYEYINPEIPEDNKKFIMVMTNNMKDVEYFDIVSTNYEYNDNYYLLVRSFLRSDANKGPNKLLFKYLKKAKKVRYATPKEGTSLSAEDARNEVALEELKKAMSKN